MGEPPASDEDRRLSVVGGFLKDETLVLVRALVPIVCVDPVPVGVVDDQKREVG
ncbi:hypothetical protein ACI8AV_00955 [Geodermatophilus sp. SYSU D00804]